jgi:hypothetical protein
MGHLKEKMPEPERLRRRDPGLHIEWRNETDQLG